ncbi:MAG TPA: DMT family transporter [Gemmatimonadales bacterium]|nr:DMT family transporter [Gemmatimonadales bacterium]
MSALILVAILVGVVLPVQSGVNAQLRIGVGHPLLAAFISFAVGTVALLGLNLAVRVPLPAGAAVTRIPWWQWTGGLLGASYIFLAIYLAPRVGAAALVASIVAGQMVTSLLLDHFGWVGYPQQPLTVTRAFGALLVIGGVLLIQRR